MLNINRLAELTRTTPEELSLVLYFNETMADDRIWCACGDEIILDPPHNDPPYMDENGQYCCWICASTTHAALNGFEP